MIISLLGAWTFASGVMRLVEAIERSGRQKENRPTDRNSRPVRYAKRSTYEN